MRVQLKKAAAAAEHNRKVIHYMSTDIISNIWPEWKTVRLLGEGSYGAVYEVLRENGEVKSHAAVKIISIPAHASELDTLRSEGMDDEASKSYFRGIVDNFLGEITIMESFKALQNIVSIEDYKVREKEDSAGFDIYIRMELLKPFNQVLRESKPDPIEVIKLGTDISTALEYCARKNVIHRDIKPENIFINEFGDYKLGDFGVARAMAANAGMTSTGTFSYMAPEVYRGSYYNATSDIYSLGLVLYRLTNRNRLPFIDINKQILTPDERARAVERRMDGESLPPPCEAPTALARVILKACDPNPAYRYQTAGELKTALENAAAQIKPESSGETEHSYVVSEPYSTAVKSPAAAQSSKKTSKGLIFAIVLLAAAIITAGALITANLISLRSSIGSGGNSNTQAELSAPETAPVILPESTPSPTHIAAPSPTPMPTPAPTPEPGAPVYNSTDCIYHTLTWSEKIESDCGFHGSFTASCKDYGCGYRFDETLMGDYSQLYWTHFDGWAAIERWELLAVGHTLEGHLKFFDSETHSFINISHNDPHLRLVFYDADYKETDMPTLTFSTVNYYENEVYTATARGYAVFVYTHNSQEYRYRIDIALNSGFSGN